MANYFEPPPKKGAVFYPSRLDPSDPVTFREGVKQFFRENPQCKEKLIAGSTQMLGFEKLDEKFGDRAEHMKKRISEVASNIIERSLQPGDRYLVVGEGMFMILFSQATEEEAEERMQVLSREIGEHIFGGEDFADVISVRSVVTTVDPPESLLVGDQEAMATLAKTAGEKAVAEDQKMAEELIGKTRLRFVPILQLHKRITSLYLVEPQRWDSKKNLIRGLDAFPRSGTHVAEMAFDSFLAENIGQRLRAEKNRRDRALILLPIRYETLSRPDSRAKFVDVCRGMPDLSRRRVVLYVNDLPFGAPQSRVRHILGIFAPLFFGIMANARIGLRLPNFVQATGLKGVVCDVAGRNALEAAEVEALPAWLQEIHGLKMKAMMINVAELEVSTRLRQAGVDYLAGDAFLPAMERPGRVFRLR